MRQASDVTRRPAVSTQLGDDTPLELLLARSEDGWRVVALG